MSGTIRRNDDNSRREIRRAEITRNRRARIRERNEEAYFDTRAFRARFEGSN